MATKIDTTQSTWQKCIDACTRCFQACEQCITSCLQEPDARARMHCIQVLRDCADICALSAQWMSRGSTFATQLCQLCADICDTCATECTSFQDQHCQDCATFCRECASECRNMAQ